MKIVVFGLTITSAWGNGHATTYRSLIKALARKGHRVTFIEKDVEWYRNNRDLPEPDFCSLELYQDWRSSGEKLIRSCFDADAIFRSTTFEIPEFASCHLKQWTHRGRGNRSGRIPFARCPDNACAKRVRVSVM